MSVCYQHSRTGQIRTREEWLQEPQITEQGIQFMVNSGILEVVPCILARDPSDMTPEELSTYGILSPLGVRLEPITVEKLFLGIILIRYMKTPEGMKQLSEIVTKYLEVVGKTMAALSSAGASHPLASLIHGRITISVYETLGLIQPKMARVMHSNFEDNINKIIAKDYLSDIIGAIVPG